ncbi:F-box domain-containing protein [Xylariales sp. AK1849]|nr:F-box domain-containing protein [Xylariales sp. AK1849]
MAHSTDPSFAKEHGISHVQTKPEHIEPVSDTSAPEEPPPCDHTLSSIPKLLKGKEREWKALQGKMGPLFLLDLPVDILRLIITHTNDLTALALTCSTLYNLSVPHIYARFDIVWPDSTVPISDSKGVDALTYGLSTLCLGSKFAQRDRWLRKSTTGIAGHSQRLVDNQYAKYTRKFSLGNGPPAWVIEYHIAKESGKMLGTLVALAVAKMVNLESFIWDMPTGVLSDVFMALASLQDHYPDSQSKLEKVWIRWHDNVPPQVGGTSSSLSSPVVQPSIPAITHVLPIHTPHSSSMQPHVSQVVHNKPPRYSESQVEYPTFSVLPPLKNLTVLDIDELSYLDEMSILIERSKDTLQELRVGISQRASSQDFVGTWEGVNLKQVDLVARWPGESTIGEKRLGGVLGVLVGRIYEIRRKGWAKSSRRHSSGTVSPNLDGASTDGIGQVSQAWANPLDSKVLPSENTLDGQNNSFSSQGKGGWPPTPSASGATVAEQNGNVLYGSHHGKKRLAGKLRVHTLELERLSLSMQVCCKAFDWSILTNLTILDCGQHETLWKVLKRQFQPSQPPYGSPPGTPVQYHLALKKIHTDVTTHALLSFIKEVLEPNTLEVLFLQDRRHTTPPIVSVDMIFKTAVKRHRSSLRKLLIDSTDKLRRDSRSEGSRWRHWVLTGDMVSYITSGRMGNLKELSVALHYKDWHTFLQRLPNVPQLRSLYVPHIQDYFGGSFEPKELALQIVDIITLRPEVKLCYVGLRDKCFEILEHSPTSGAIDQFGMNGYAHHYNTGAISVIDVDDESNGNGDNSDADETDDDETGTVASTPDAEDDEFTEVSDEVESEADDFEEPESSQSSTRLRLREILFYDDKVAIFKARHGRL